METIQLHLDKRQFINLFRSMNESDKLEIYKELKLNLSPNRFDSLLQSLKTDSLSLDDITKEVEEVRKERYEKGKQNL
ncbi:hypothetical protein Barb7_02572 [Bacteroidales bacterium Barb7]|nr:hypothetical protein Barb7_02572 [Bacteroidales bacterium Barb7]